MRFRRMFRPMLGLLLIAISVGMLFWWENAGREKFLMKEVNVLAHNLKAGSTVKGSDIKIIRINEEALQKGALLPHNASELIGMVSKRDIRAGEQLHRQDFKSKDDILEKGMSIYTIKPEWINNRSCSLRKGDYLRIYDAGGNEEFGNFRIAHVKSETEQEVVDAEGTNEKNAEKRDFASSQISFVEIYCKIADYQRIFDACELGGGSLLLVQEVADV